MPYPSKDLLEPILALYETTWPGLAPLIKLARGLGWDWSEVSTPFVAEVDGAIRAHPRRRHRMAARPVLIVDDVMTSGATFAACTEACLKAGAKEVFTLALARAARED